MKYAKGVAACFLSLSLLFSLTACGDSTGNTEKSLYDQGLELVTLMNEMAESEEYLAAYSSSPDLAAVVHEIAQGDYSEPKAVFAISPGEEFYAIFMEMASMNNLSDTLKDAMADKAMTAILTQVNAMGGTSTLAATAACTAGKTFVCSDADSNVIYLYTYEDAYPVGISFVTGEGGAVSASGTFVAYDDFTCGSTDEIKAFFTDYELEVSEIEP